MMSNNGLKDSVVDQNKSVALCVGKGEGDKVRKTGVD
jgi:hypothetical protein